ncbi:MAG: hypothetical protein JSS66_10460 [Armatimonadetes bacterium]|nr:hypothetical protein [Armatimonadota bacterium]
MRFLVLAALIIGTVTSSFSADLTVTYRPVWPGISKSDCFVPLMVTVTNKGLNTVGILNVESRLSRYGVPMELPKGSVKEVQVLVARSDPWEEVSLKLKTPVGDVPTQVETAASEEGSTRTVGVISDTEGLLAGVRARRSSKAMPLFDSTCKPSEAPERSVGYSSLDAVVLGDGSERISDSAVRAIKRWVLEGGVLVMPGGAGAPWLRDERWEWARPVKVRQPVIVQDVAALAAFTSTPLTGGITVMESDPTLGSRTVAKAGAVPLIVRRQVGMGSVWFWAFDPFSAPLSTWDGRRVLVNTAVVAHDRSSDLLQTLVQRQGTSETVSGTNQEEDPFTARLPGSEKIVGILLLFFVVAVPMNFFALGRAGRKELAWVTLPALSLMFSYALYLSAGKLYSGTAARATHGFLVVADGLKEGTFIGTQRLFLPQGGVYDFKFQGVEAISNPDRGYRMMGMDTSATDVPEYLDAGQMVAPAVGVSNLTFRQHSLVQAFPADWRLDVETKKGPDGIVTGRLTNTSPYDFDAVRMNYNGVASTSGALPVGKTLEFKIGSHSGPSSNWNSHATPKVGEGLVLQAVVSGLPVGSSVGVVAKRHDDTSLIYTWGDIVK